MSCRVARLASIPLRPRPDFRTATRWPTRPLFGRFSGQGIRESRVVAVSELRTLSTYRESWKGPGGQMRYCRCCCFRSRCLSRRKISFFVFPLLVSFLHIPPSLLSETPIPSTRGHGPARQGCLFLLSSVLRLLPSCTAVSPP